MTKDSKIVLKDGTILNEIIWGFHYDKDKDDIILDFCYDDQRDMPETIDLKDVESIISWVEFMHPETRQLAKEKQECIPFYREHLERFRRDAKILELDGKKYTLLVEFYCEEYHRIKKELSRGILKEIIMWSYDKKYIDKEIERFSDINVLKDWLKIMFKGARVLTPYNLILETEVCNFVEDE